MTYLLLFLETAKHLQVRLLNQLLIDFELVGFFVIIELLDKRFLPEIVVLLLELVRTRIKSLFLLRLGEVGTCCCCRLSFLVGGAGCVRQ